MLFRSVEDGTGIADADSYVAVEFADDYFSARGVSAWADLEAEANSATTGSLQKVLKTICALQYP